MEPTKKSGAKWLIIGAIIVIIIGGYFWTSYNGLVKQNEGVTAGWAQVESQYQRRFDLIPNLVESVKGIMAQEQEVFTAIADARTRYAGAGSSDEKAAAAGALEGAFGRLLVVMENYPQLKSAETVQSLMAEIAGSENRIAVERMRYNELVRDYNVAVKTFPRSLLAGMFGFEARTMFEAKVGAEEAPAVKF